MGTIEDKIAARLEAIGKKSSENTEEDSIEIEDEVETEEVNSEVEDSEDESENNEQDEELGSGGLSALRKLREENKALRREGGESKQKYDELVSLLSKHLGLEEDTEVEDSLTKAQNRAIQLEREKSVILNPGVGNPERLLRDKFFLEELYALEQDDAKSIKKLIKSFCDDNPYLKASAKNSGVNITGGQSRKNATPKTALEKAREARLKAIGKI